MFLAAGHDGAVMAELRQIAFGIEDGDDLGQQYKNAQLNKKHIHQKAQQKSLRGIKIPETREEVNQKGRHIAIHTLSTIEEQDEEE